MPIGIRLFYKYCFLILLFIGVFTCNVSAKNWPPISQMLWHGISEDDLEILKKITLEIKHKNYQEALILSDNLKKEKQSDPDLEQNHILKNRPDFSNAVKNIILWHKYSGEINLDSTNFSDISRFVIDNDFYPNQSVLSNNVEKLAIAKNIPYKLSEKYFNKSPARQTKSQIYLLKSKIDFLSNSNLSNSEKLKLEKEIQKIIAKIWIEKNFDAKEEQEFLINYQNQLNEIDHINRIDYLLWNSKVSQAKRIINLVGEDYQKLFKAIIKISKNPQYINQIILSVPRKLRSNELLSYRRVLWYKTHNKSKDALKVIFNLPRYSQFPEKWWSLRHLYARELLKTKQYKKSYFIASNNALPVDAAKFWEAQWFSGWVALRFLNNPKNAKKHFEILYNNVTQPVSKSRASYWLAMTYEAMDNKDKAIEWYKIAVKYPTFFYGQLAIHKHRLLEPIKARSDIILPKDPRITKRNIFNMSNSTALQVAYLLMLMQDQKTAEKIFIWVIKNSYNKGQIAVTMKLVNEMRDRALDVKISRYAAKKNVFFIKDKFQIVDEIKNNKYAPLVHSIVKQESGFAPTALSHVGAVGFMQIMPDTAKQIAKDIGIKYSRRKLARNIKYNVRLGSFYIKQLIDRFEGSELLAIASYNAGPHNADRWIDEFYDPRQVKDIDKVVDWIELITYSETRNYVQRIMENLIVYKYLMSRSNYDDIS